MKLRPIESFGWGLPLSYGLAIALPVLALFAKAEIFPIFVHARYFLNIVSIVLVSLYGGLGPGIIAILISVLGSAFFFLGPVHSFKVENTQDLLLLCLFGTTGILTALVSAQLRRSLQISREERERAEYATSARMNLLAAVSHDLKNPVTAIQLKKDLALRALDAAHLDPPKIRRQLESIGATAEHMSRLIQELLDTETIETGHLKVALAPEDFRSVLLQVSELYQPIAERKLVSLKIGIPDASMRVLCDRTRIVQVLSNLVGNAIKFTSEGGTIEVTTKDSGDSLLVTVKDTGPGIRSENLPKVFGRHWQAEGAFRSGQGLGLYIVKGIVDAHHEKIWVESTLGLGTEFHFTLSKERAV